MLHLEEGARCCRPGRRRPPGTPAGFKLVAAPRWSAGQAASVSAEDERAGISAPVATEGPPLQIQARPPGVTGRIHGQGERPPPTPIPTRPKQPSPSWIFSAATQSRVPKCQTPGPTCACEICRQELISMRASTSSRVISTDNEHGYRPAMARMHMMDSTANPRWHPVEVIVDVGSGLSMIHTNLINRHWLPKIIASEQDARSVDGIGGARTLEFYAFVTLRMGNYLYKARCAVTDCDTFADSILLGNDFLDSYGARIHLDGDKSTLHLRGNPSSINLEVLSRPRYVEVVGRASRIPKPAAPSAPPAAPAPAPVPNPAPAPAPPAVDALPRIPRRSPSPAARPRRSSRSSSPVTAAARTSRPTAHAFVVTVKQPLVATLLPDPQPSPSEPTSNPPPPVWNPTDLKDRDRTGPRGHGSNDDPYHPAIT